LNERSSKTIFLKGNAWWQASSRRLALFGTLSLTAPGLALGTSSALGTSKVPARQSAKRPEAAANPSGWFAQGQSALQSGDLGTAEAAFRRVLEADPNAAPAYVNLGVIAMRRKQWDNALTLLRRAEKLDPNLPGIRLNIGLLQFRRGKYDAAIPEFVSVLRDQPDSTQARYLLGLCQVLTEKFADAVTTFQPLWDSSSNDVAYLYTFDIAANKSGQKELDDRILEQMLKVANDTPEFHLIMGKAYLNRQEIPQAIEELKRAAAAKDDLAYVHFQLGFAYMMEGNMEQAEAEFLRDVAVEPDLPDTYEQLGILYGRTQRPEKSQECLRKSIKMDPKRPGPHMELAKIYFNSRKDQDALREVNLALQLDPHARGGNFLKGRVLQRMGRTEEAEVEFAKARQVLGQGLEKDREDVSRRINDPALTKQP
jgi:tetratricopeptide (TPR) repeat protein